MTDRQFPILAALCDPKPAQPHPLAYATYGGALPLRFGCVVDGKLAAMIWTHES